MKIHFRSLGCDKNLVDSERMIGKLWENGFTLTDFEEEAEVIVINTCCFIGDAKEESIQTILELADYKMNGACKVMIVAGCLSQRYKEELLKELPEVDAIIGISDIDDIVDVIKAALAGKGGNFVGDCNAAPVYGQKRALSTGGHYAFLKIAEGCDKYCTYCIIPKIRGKYRSVPMEDLLNEAKLLVEGGVKEFILVAQETTLYGMDLYGKKMLPELLRRLADIEGLEWIRIQYCYPEEITDELIETIASTDKICNYLDIPIQHAADSILQRMGRKTSEADLRNVIARLRKRIPDICLRTTLISGFPGETQEDFETLYRFVNEMEFDRLGVFTYSPEEDTPAATMEGQIEEEVKAFRRDELMLLQQEIAFEKAERQVGRRLLCMIEGYIPEDNVYVGRTYMDAPSVDGYIFIKSHRELLSGQFVNVMITQAREYDLLGEEDEFTE